MQVRGVPLCPKKAAGVRTDSTEAPTYIPAIRCTRTAGTGAATAATVEPSAMAAGGEGMRECPGGDSRCFGASLSCHRARVGCLLVCVGVHMWGSGGGGQSGLIGTERLMLYTAALQV